jgi:hypothetical protein
MQLMGDGITATNVAPAGDADQIVTTEMTRSSESRAVFRLSLGGPVAGARARVRPAGKREAITVCSHRPARPLFRPGSPVGVLRTDFESEAYYGAGWGNQERNQAGSFRRAEARSTLLLPLDRGFTYHVALDLSSEDDARIAAALNGEPVGHCDLRGHAGCDLTLPAVAVREPVSALTLDRTGSAGRRLVFRGARITRQQEDEPGPRQ